MNWIFLGIIVGAIAYLMLVIFSFIEKHREGREKIEQTQIDIKRLETQLGESEKARMEAENRTARLEEESLGIEHRVSELHHKINSALPAGAKTPTS